MGSAGTGDKFISAEPAAEVVDVSIPWHWCKWSAWSEVRRNERLSSRAVLELKAQGLEGKYTVIPRVEIIQHRHCVMCNKLESRSVLENG